MTEETTDKELNTVSPEEVSEEFQDSGTVIQKLSADPALVFLVQQINGLIERNNEQAKTIQMLHAALQQHNMQLKQLTASMESMSGVLTMNCKQIEILKGIDGDIVQYNH